MTLSTPSTDSVDPGDTAPAAPSTDSVDTVDALPDSQLLGDVVRSLPVSRASAYKLLAVLGIDTRNAPSPSGRGRVAWIAQEDVRRLILAAERVASGETIASQAGGLQRPHRRESVSTLETLPESAPSTDSRDTGDTMLRRLQAIELAISTGAPLTSAEAAYALLARPGGDRVQRGRLVAVRHARNLWTLEQAGTGQS